MRKKWGPLIGGILIGFIIMAMRYEKVVDYSKVIPKNDIVYEISTDRPFTGKVEIYFENSKQLSFSAEYKKGKPHGETVEYYENGNIKEKYFYKKENFTVHLKVMMKMENFLKNINIKMGLW